MFNSCRLLSQTPLAASFSSDLTSTSPGQLFSTDDAEIQDANLNMEAESSADDIFDSIIKSKLGSILNVTLTGLLDIEDALAIMNKCDERKRMEVCATISLTKNHSIFHSSSVTFVFMSFYELIITCIILSASRLPLVALSSPFVHSSTLHSQAGTQT